MTTLFKDLTLEQQERLVEVFNEVVYIPEDATHIDLGWHTPHTNCVMKLDSNWNMYYLCNETDCVDDFYWVDERNIGRMKLFPIPDDFNRQTGEIMSMDKPLPTQPDLPDFDFKLSCGDRPEVRQWLKYNGCKWSNGQDITTHLNSLKDYTIEGVIYIIDKSAYIWVDQDDFVEIQPTFTVTGFTVPESEKKRKETLDKIKEKEDTIKRLTDEINQLKQENQND